MQTDYHLTGKFYKKLDAFVKGNGNQATPYENSYYYFGSTIQFKTCKSFKAYLQTKHPFAKFQVNIARA